MTAEKSLVRNKRNSGGQITEEESTNNTMYEWLTSPVRKCRIETLLTPTNHFVLFFHAPSQVSAGSRDITTDIYINRERRNLGSVFTCFHSL